MLSTEQVDQAVERYWREYDRYTKLAELVGETCRGLMRENLIRASVHWRAKSRESLRRKLTVKYVTKLQSVDEVFTVVGDLAAVRVMTYVEADRRRVVELLTEAFASGESQPKVKVEEKDKHKNGSFYRATHCQVHVRDDELIGRYENLRGLSCEIQVCSMLAHVWNELEHDLVYKPQTGNLSGPERDLLAVLGNQTLAGDGIIIRLLAETADRQKEETGEFADEYDFVSRIRDRFPTVESFHRHAEQLFDVLSELGIDSPTKLDATIIAPSDTAEKRGRDLVRKFIVDAKDHWSAAYTDLNDDSSDVLMMLVFEKCASDIVGRHPGGPGKGRPSRIVYAARLWEDLKKPPSTSVGAPAPVFPGPAGTTTLAVAEPAD